MGYRLLALDIDDTLLNSEGQITDRVRAAVNAAHEAGVTVALCTGRMQATMLPVARDIGIKGMPLIAFGGAQVWVDDELAYKRYVPSDYAKQILDYTLGNGLHCHAFLWDDFIVEKKNKHSEHYGARHNIEAIEIPELRRMRRIDTPKLLMMDEPAVIEEWRVKLQNRFGDSVRFTKSSPIMLEANHPGGTKGKALEAMAGMLGIDRSEVIAMGDAAIDISMLEYAGLGVAMGNATDDTKAAADYICPTNDEDGVAVTIEKYILEGRA